MGKLLLVIKNSWLIFCLTLFIVLCSCTEVSFGFSTQRKFSCLCTDSQLKNYSIEKLPAIAECSISLKEYFYIGSIIYRELKQYKPIGQPVSALEQFPSENDKLKVEIQIDSTIYFQGKAINLLFKITNISDHPVKLRSLVPFSMYNISRAASIFPVNGVYYLPGNIVLEPGEDYYKSTPLLQWYSSYNNDWQDTTVFKYYYMGAGEYSFKLGISYDNGNDATVLSNEIFFNIVPVPDSLKQSIRLLSEADRLNINEAVSADSKYENNFLEYEIQSFILKKLYTGYSVYSSEYNAQMKDFYLFVLKFVRKYPNTGFATNLIDWIIKIKTDYPPLFETNKDWLLDQNTWIGLILTNELNRREK